MKEKDDIFEYCMETSAGSIYAGKKYFFDFLRSQIYCINKNCVEKKIVIEEIEKQAHLFGTVLKKEPYFYIAPNNGNRMIRYHCDEEKLDYIVLGKDYLMKDGYCHFTSGSVIENRLFLFSAKAEKVICFDTEKNAIDLIDFSKEKIRTEAPLIRRSTVVEREIWTAEDGGNIVFIIDSKTLKVESIQLKEEIAIVDICYEKNEVFLLDLSGKIFSVDPKSRKEKFVVDTGRKKYGFIIKTENWIWLIPQGAENIIKISEKQGVDEIKYPSDYKFANYCLKKGPRAFANIIDQELYVYTLPRNNNYMIEIDKIREEIYFKKIVYSRELRSQIKEELFDNMVRKRKIEKETNGGLNLFLEIVKNRQ